MADTDLDVRQIALTAWDAGLCPIPIKSDGSKSPPIKWKHYQKQRPTRAEVEQWFTRYRAVGVICGQVSGGLVMIEMEGAFYDEDYWSRFRAAVLERISEDRWREITAYVEMSPSGGPHLYVRCPGFSDGNEKLAKALRPNPETGELEPTDVMETRGEGGYSVIAGSVGHESGNAWTIARGGSIADIATVTRTELDLILDAARTLDELPDPEPPPEPKHRNGAPYQGESWMDATIDAYNRAHKVTEFATGFEPTGTETYKGETVVRLRRIGSDNPHGASIYPSGRIGFFTSNAPAGCDYYDGKSKLPTYDAFTLALLSRGRRDYAEDRVAFALELRAEGYGPPLKQKEPQSDPFGRDRPPLGAKPADTTTGEVESTDDGPVPLDRFDLPLFPLDVLPKWMRSEVVATARAIQAPVEIAAGVALVAISTAIAGKVDVDGINYRQPTNLYLSVVAASGIGKSPVASRLFGPLYDLEEQMGVQAQSAIAEAVAEMTAVEEQIAAAKGLLKKDPSSIHAKAAMRDAELARITTEVPQTPRLIADDHTPEALGHLIAGQKGTRIAVLSPEGATLFSTMTGARYKSGGDAPPEVPPVYLKAWGGEPMPIDRKGAGSIMVKRPILTVGVLVQPFVVDRLAMTPQIAAQGALARFLWVVARDNVGQRNRRERRNTEPVSSEYVEKLTTLARRCLSWQMPACLTATEEAADHLDDLNDERERRMGLGGDLDAYREIEAKMVGYQWRLAAVLAMAHGDDIGAGITLVRAKQAGELAEYFLAHSIAVHRRAGLDERGGTLRACAAYVAKHAGEQIDWRDFQLSMRSVYNAMTDAQADLEELVRMKWVVVEAGELSAVGVKGASNPQVKVDARTRAFSAGRDTA